MRHGRSIRTLSNRLTRCVVGSGIAIPGLRRLGMAPIITGAALSVCPNAVNNVRSMQATLVAHARHPPGTPRAGVKTRLPLRSLIDTQKAFMGMKFLTYKGSRDSLKQRCVQMPGAGNAAVPNLAFCDAVACGRTERTAVPTSDGTQSTPQSKVVVVGGERGSGKTVSVLQWASSGDNRYCVYLLASDLFPSDMELRDKDTRNRKIEAKLQSVLGEILTLKEKYEDNTGLLTIVIDDIGSHARLQQGLCSISFDGLRKVSGVNDVMLVAVGTGVDAATNEVGSLPSRYHRVHVTSTSVALAMWKDLLRVQKVETHFDDAMVAFDYLLKCAVDTKSKNQALAHAIEGSPRLKQMLRDMATNARLTALLHRCLRTPRDNQMKCCTGAEHRTMWRHRVQHAVKEAMICFRSMNALSGQSMKQCMEHFAVAFASACGGHHQTLPDGWDQLITTYGMVTDNAVIMKEVDDTTHVVIRELDSGEYLCIPAEKEHRYSITAAQMALAMCQFGFSEPPEWSCGGFEAALADYFWLVSMAGMSGATIRANEVAAPCSTMATVRSLLLGWTGELLASAPELPRTVWRVKLQRAVASEAAAQEALEALHSERFNSSSGPLGLTVIVALNADKAPFADVMVAGFVGGAMRWMLFLQAKHASSGRGLSTETYWEEMYQTGCREELASVKAGFEMHFKELLGCLFTLRYFSRPGPPWALLQCSILHVAECSLRLGIDEDALSDLITGKRRSVVRDVVDAVHTLVIRDVSDEQLNARIDFVAGVMELKKYKCEWKHATVGVVSAGVKVKRYIIALLRDNDQPPEDVPKDLVHFNRGSAMEAFAPTSIGCLAGTAPASYNERLVRF